MAVFYLKSDEAFLELIDIKASYDDLLDLMPQDEPSRRFLQMIGDRFGCFLRDGVQKGEIVLYEVPPGPPVTTTTT